MENAIKYITSAAKASIEHKYGKNVSGNANVDFGSITYSFLQDSGRAKDCILEVVFEEAAGSVEYTDGAEVFSETVSGASIMFKIGFKTKGGYISSKKLPVEYNNKNDLTVDEVLELLQYETDGKINTFDPFYKENLAKWKNSAAWASLIRDGSIKKSYL